MWWVEMIGYACLCVFLFAAGCGTAFVLLARWGGEGHLTEEESDMVQQRRFEIEESLRMFQ
jgi:hypothetical protein